jgi:hypothetical protein
MNHKKDLRHILLSSKQKHVNDEHNSKWSRTYQPSLSSSDKSDAERERKTSLGTNQIRFVRDNLDSVEEKQIYSRDDTWNELKRKHREPCVNQSELMNTTVFHKNIAKGSIVHMSGTSGRFKLLCTECKKYSTEILYLKKNIEDITAEKEKHKAEARDAEFKIMFYEAGVCGKIDQTFVSKIIGQTKDLLKNVSNLESEIKCENKSLGKNQQIAKIKSKVSDMVNRINLYINTCKDFVQEKDETCEKLVENLDKTMNYEKYVSDMNGMQEEISSHSELLFEKDQQILVLQAKIEKLEEYKETTEGFILSGKTLLDENKASEQAVIELKSKEEEYCKSIEELKKLKEQSKQILLNGQDQELFPINCFFLTEKYTNYALEIKKNARRTCVEHEKS